MTNCPDAAGLIDHPRTFPLAWSMLGWNVHIYHSHLDVHPPIRVPKPFRFEWHQDGGRQNRGIETDPRPRLSVKLAFWLSDVSETGRGNFKVVPGSHVQNWIDGPPRRDVEWPEPEGDHCWGHYPQTTPLHGWLKERNLPDPANSPLRP